MGIGRRVPVGPQRNILGVPKQRPSHVTLFVHDHLVLPALSFSLLGFRVGNDLVFRMKRSTLLRRPMIAYCDRKSVEFNSMRIVYDGVRLISSRTPDEDVLFADEFSQNLTEYLLLRYDFGFRSRDVIYALPVLGGGGAP